MTPAKFEAYQRLALSTVYAEGDSGYHRSLIPRQVQRWFVPLGLPTSSVILDVGCGPGLFLTDIRARGFGSAVGVTLSPEDAQACRAAGHGVIESDFSDIALPSRQIDFIWCRHALEHSPYPLFTLFEYNRLLRLAQSVPAETMDTVPAD